VVLLAWIAVMVLPATGAGAAVKVTVPCGGAKGGTKGLIAAIKRANTHGGGTIKLAHRCRYTLTTGPFDNGKGPNGLPPIGSRITIKGHGSSIVRAKRSPEFRLLEVDSSRSASLRISRTVLRNGNVSHATNDQGGAILLGHRGGLVVRRCTLAFNSAVNGGAINAGGARVKIVDSTLRGNRAVLVDGVGGAVLSVGGPVRVESSLVTNNRSSGGGGGISGQSIGGRPSLLKITDSTVSKNSTLENGGGGVYAFGPERLIIRRSAILENRLPSSGAAGTGGGIASQGRMTISDSTISGNVAGARGLPSVEGGAIFNAPGAKGTISSTTIAGNRALGPGATGGGIAHGSALRLSATIVAKNRGGNCLGHVRDGGFDLEDGTSCGFAKHAVKANPRVASPAKNGGPTKTMALGRRSRAINRVRAKSAECRGTVDQRGVPRPQSRRCDIGAFEVVATKAALHLRDRNGSGNRLKLTVIVTPAVSLPGPPMGKVVIRDRRTVLGKRQLDARKPDAASLRVRLNAGKHRLTASFRGSRLFLASTSKPHRLMLERP
jgi:hypothetical protein